MTQFKQRIKNEKVGLKGYETEVKASNSRSKESQKESGAKEHWRKKMTKTYQFGKTHTPIDRRNGTNPNQDKAKYTYVTIGQLKFL